MLLLNTEDKLVNEAIEIYKTSVNNSGHKILVDLKFKGEKEKIPEYSKNILENLEQKSLKETKSIPKFLHVPPNGFVRGNTIMENWKDKLELILIMTLVATIPILVIIGIIQVVKWIL